MPRIANNLVAEVTLRIYLKSRCRGYRPTGFFVPENWLDLSKHLALPWYHVTSILGLLEIRERERKQLAKNQKHKLIQSDLSSGITVKINWKAKLNKI